MEEPPLSHIEDLDNASAVSSRSHQSASAVASVDSSSQTSLSAIQSGSQQFIALLYSEKRLSFLFQGFRTALTREEFILAFSTHLATLASGLMHEAKSAAEFDAARFLEKKRWRLRIAKDLAIKILNAEAAFPVDQNTADPNKRTAQWTQKVHPGAPVDLSQVTTVEGGNLGGDGACVDDADDNGEHSDQLDDLPETARAFIARSRAFRDFCDKLIDDHAMEDASLRENNHGASSVPTQSELSSVPISPLPQNSSSDGERSVSGDVTPRPIVDSLEIRQNEITRLLTLAMSDNLVQNQHSDVPSVEEHSLDSLQSNESMSSASVDVVPGPQNEILDGSRPDRGSSSLVTSQLVTERIAGGKQGTLHWL